MVSWSLPRRRRLTLPLAPLLAVVFAVCLTGPGGGGLFGSAAHAQTESGVGLEPPVLALPPGAFPPVAAGAAITDEEAIRFLQQCSFGPTKAEIDRVKAMGFEAYIDDQFAQPMSNYLYTTSFTFDANFTGIKQRFFHNAVRQPDQLRQRLAFALSQIIVVSVADGNYLSEFRPSVAMSYYHLLSRHALGNYRDLLYDFSLNAPMGVYLSMINNAKANAATNSQPNENYARELLQLFSIGVYVLNQDGTVQIDLEGNPVPSYGNEEVTEFSRVFTGWTWAPRFGGIPTGLGNPYPYNYASPMALAFNSGNTTANNRTQHDLGIAGNGVVGPKRLLNGLELPPYTGTLTSTSGAAVSAYAYNELNQAINNIMAHQNTAPFVSKQLIQHLVTANPSPGYVRDVAAVFSNNGQGVRGDMKAVTKAILLHPEARSAIIAQSTPGYGHWRSGILFMTNLLRQLNVTGDLFGLDNNGLWAFYLRQPVMSPPTVFSYYMPSSTIDTEQGVFSAPEFETFTTESAIRRVNFVNQLVMIGTVNGGVGTKGTGVTALDLTDFTAALSSGGVTGLVNLVNQRFMHGTMSAALRTQVTNAVNAVASTNPTKRAKTAIFLTTCSQEYQVQR